MSDSIRPDDPPNYANAETILPPPPPDAATVPPREGMPVAAPPKPAAPPPPAPPGYEILDELGRGGMGVVYKARHLALKRTVALKMVLAGGHAGPGERARFRIEAEAVARLQHPNIVQIHEVGETHGHPYCALEFVEGGNLAGKLDGKPMPGREAAKLVEALARAMQLAHSRNVVHRDLKPANVLLTADGTPKITDFGLARQLDKDSGETQAGAVMGTPAYMAPEQASGLAHEAGPAADVYALGAILYDCLSGQPPFQGKTVFETLDRVRTEEPVPPSRRQPGVPLDLDTICLKCLRKEPENRYTSAAALANELVRYLNGEPIQARPVGQLERSVKWVKRNPGLAASLTGLVGIVVAAFGLVSWSYFHAESARQDEARQRREANDARDEAQRKEKAERWGRYRSNIAAASGALQLQNGGAARAALDDAPEEHRNWEWRYLRSQLDGASHNLAVPGGKVKRLVLSPSGRQIAVCCFDHNEAYLYDVATGKLDATFRGHAAPATSVAYRPDGKQVATVGDDQTLRLWDPATGQQTALLKADVVVAQGHEERDLCLTYNADGTRIASHPSWEEGAGTSRLWDVTAGKELAVLGKWQAIGCPIAWSPDSKRVAVGSGEFVHLVDVGTGRRLAVLGPHPKTVRIVAYSPDGKRIASATSTEGANAIHLWDGASGQEVAVMSGHTASVQTMAFSPDGSRLVSGSAHPDNTARLWDAATGAELSVLAGHKNGIALVALSPDGQRAATGSQEHMARLWDGTTGKVLAVLGGHTDKVWQVLFNPSGTRVVTAAEDATLRLWDARTGEGIGVLRGHGDGFRAALVFTPDGSRLVSGSRDGTVRIWDMSLVERNGILRGHESYVYDVAFRPDGEQVASAAWDHTARLWDATTGRPTGLLRHEKGLVISVTYDRDGRRLATRARARERPGDDVKLWEVATQKVVHGWIPAPGFDSRASLNPEGTLLAAGGDDGAVRLWDTAAGQEVPSLKDHDKDLIDVAFQPGGHLVAASARDGTIRLLDVATRAPVAVLRGHTDVVWRVAFRADGQLLASCSQDKTICFWDPQTYEPLQVLPVGSVVYGVAFHPDGTRLAAGCADHTIRLFDVATREQVAELRGHGDYVHAVAWSQDGTRLVSGSGDTTVRIWDSLSPQERAKRLRAP